MAGFALAAVWADPTEPVRQAGVAYTLLAVYLVCSLVLLIWISRSALLPQPATLLIHGADLGAAVAINYFTGSDSPFFVLFVFLLIAATLRWRYRGVLWTAVLALLAFVTLGIVGPGGASDPDFELGRFLMRCGYLVVTAGLLGSLGRYQGRLQHDLLRLAASPGAPPATPAEAVSTVLDHAGRILDHPRLALLLDDPDEPWTDLVVRDARGEQLQRLAPDEVEGSVHPELEGSVFLCADLHAARPAAILSRGGERLHWSSGPPVDRTLVQRLGARSVLALPIEGELARGWLLALDERRLDPDDLVVGTILARQSAALLDAGLFSARLQRSATTQERLRLARELHDGITQAITGAAFQLGSVRRQIAQNPRQAATVLDEIQQLLLDEHRQLRLFIQELRPEASVGKESLSSLLEAMTQRVAMLWSLEVTSRVDGPVPEALVREIYRIVQEATINAARHAGAAKVSIVVTGSPEEARVVVRDDGRGFAFRGRLELPQLVEQKLGPVSLKERVQFLRGSLSIASTEEGSSIEILLPASPERPR